MFGASVSWILRIFITSFLVYKFIVLVSRKNPSVTRTTGIRSPEEEEVFRPQEQGFDFAFGLRKPLDPSIGYFTVKYINQTVLDDGSRPKERTKLDFADCGNSHFNYKDQEEVKKFGINKFNCITNDDYSFFGNFYQRNMQYVELKLWKCKNDTDDLPKGTVCKNQKTIDEYFKDETFSFAFVNQMFALENYDQPIFSFIDDQLFFELDPTVSKRANFFIQRQVYELEDTLVQLGQKVEDEYFQITNIKSYEDMYSDSDGYIVAVYMRSDKLFDKYERQVYDILTFLGDIGGLTEALISIGTLIVGFFTQKMFMSKIVRKIYHIRNYDNIEHETQERLKRQST